MGESIETEQYNLFQDLKYKYALTGIRAVEGLNGKVYEQGEENSISIHKKEILEDLTQIFRKMKKMCSENVTAWIEDIVKRLKEYKKHTGILNNPDFKL